METKSGAMAQAAWPIVKTTISQTSSVLRGTRDVTMVSSGPPTAMPDRIARHQIAGARHRDAKTRRDLRQHAGDDELGRAEGEGGEEEGNERERHGDSVGVDGSARNHERADAAIWKL